MWSATEVRNARLYIQFIHLGLIFLTLPLAVYCCCCLANISIPGIGVAVPEFRPFFYINVADIGALENELSYVACKLLLTWFAWFCGLLMEPLSVFATAGTTEKIFEEKKDLYDVYVDNQNVKTCRDGLKPLLRLSAADREKYRKLTEQRFDQCKANICILLYTYI